MVYEFQSLEELEEAIIEDNEDNSISSKRFPIRFIFLNSQDEMKKIVTLLNKFNVKRKELSSLLYSPNSWFSDSQLMDEIKDIDDTSIVLPLSEYIRFSSDENFKEMITSLSEMENNKIKIYVPLVGLWGRFKSLFWDKFYRKDNWAPIWKLKTEPKKIKIYQINFDLKNPTKPKNMELVSNSKEWFELWKKDNVTDIISLTKQLSLFFNNSLPDQSFYQELLNDPKEYLSEILGIDIDVDYKNEELEYWNDLLLNLTKENKKYNNFIDYFNDRFNIKDAREMTEFEFVELYHKSSNSYDKWIIKNFFLDSKIYKDTYLYECFESLDVLDNKNLSKKIFLKIFDKEEVEDSYFEERRNLLNLLSKQYPFVFNNEFENKYRNIENLNYKVQLKYLTDNTPVEKQKIIRIIQENGVENTKNYIKNIYPELYYYLDWNITLSNVDSWITDYFKEYNESKVLNSKSSKLTHLLDEKNHPDEIHNWRYNVKPNSKIKNDIGEYRVWIDGLGAEWLPLLIHLLNEYGEKYGKYVSYKNINSVNLPSATKFNKVDCDYKISNLDKYIHDNHYSYPNSLIEEIEIIKKLAMDIVSLDYSKISITSDHGFSFLSNSKFGCSKKYNFENAEHGGRYVLSNQKGNDNEDYVYVKTENDDFDGIYAVASKHTSLNNTPSYEVHGGATPEEVLIPQIIIENDDNKIDYKVSTELSKINISKDSKLPIKITPMPSTSPIAIFNDEKLDIDKNNDEYYINLDSKMNAGKQSIIIKINDEIVGEIAIEIEKGGMKTADDDWF